MNRGFLLDTNVVSEVVRPRPAPEVIAWLNTQPEEIQAISVVTLGELHKGLALATDERKNRLEEFVLKAVPSKFAGRILPVTEVVAKKWGLLIAHRKRIGRPLSAIDGLIAATALEHGLTLVTRNVDDFSYLPELSVFNPWEVAEA